MPMMLLRYWREGALALLCIACLIFWLIAKGEARRADKWQQAAAEAEAQVAVQNEAIRAAGEAQIRAEQAFGRARDAGARIIVQGQADKARVADTPANGCPTPSQVMEAPL
jgi:hypothetical protein